MEYEIITDPAKIDRKEWSDFVNSNKRSSYFHSFEYYLVLKEVKRIKPLIISVKKNKKLVGLMIGEMGDEVNSLPLITRRTIFYDFPIFDCIKTLDLLLEKLGGIYVGLFVQIRPFYVLSGAENSILCNRGFKFSDHLNSYIELDNIKSVYENFKKDKKKGINKAKNKYKLKIIECRFDDYNSIDISYNMLKVLYKRKHHLLKSKDYFYNTINKSNGYAKIILSFFKDIPIATQLYLINKNRLITFYTATLFEYKDKHAGDLLIWYLIKKAFANNIKVFDFGGGGNPEKNYSPKLYKERFGAIFDNVGRYTLQKSFLYNFFLWVYNKILRN